VKQALAAAARDSALGAALDLHRAGKLAEAIHAYRIILESDDRDADAAFLCGMAALAAGALEAAANLFMGALQIDPSRADFHAHLGLVHGQGGDLATGVPPLTRAMLLAPAEASIAFNLGQILDRAGFLARSFTALRASAHLQPDHAASWVEFGAVAREMARPSVANLALLMALRLDDAAPRAWFNIAMLRADQSLNDDAETGFRRAVELDPNYVEAIGNLGNHLRGVRRRGEARAVLLDGIGRHPLSARLWAALSAVDFDDDKVAEADSAARRASMLDPGLVDAVANLAQSLHRAGLTGEAVRIGARAGLLAPGDHRLQFNQATYLLGDGRLEAGWDSYEARLARIPEQVRLRQPGSEWPQGAPPGRHLVVVAEQGLGDELLFATCFPDLDGMLGRGELDSVIVECDPRLRPLIRRSFPAFQVTPRPISQRIDGAAPASGGETTGADRHVFAGSLPGRFRRDLADFPGTGNLLVPDPDRVAHWREYLESKADTPVFGLTWRSMSRRDRGDVYYPPIESLAPILETPDIRFVTLQYDDPEPDLREIEARFGIQIIRPKGLDPMNDLDEVAALLKATDGMVSAYTAALNLAGILGVPAFTATYGYYWPTLGTGALPWYPSVTIEMRTGAESWDAAVQRLANRFRAAIRA
jgi:Tfp pilus assembly protein PilF